MNTILIFGCSDRIADWRQGLTSWQHQQERTFNTASPFSKLEEAVFDRIKVYPSIGLNRFPEFFPFVDYWLWIDNKNFGNCIYKRNNNGDLIAKRYYKPYFKFKPNIELFGAYTVTSFALDFAVKQGYERAVLYGILDGEYKLIEKKGFHVGHWDFSYKHFYDDKSRRVPMQKLQQFKSIINSYKDKIEVEIPYMTI